MPLLALGLYVPLYETDEERREGLEQQPSYKDEIVLGPRQKPRGPSSEPDPGSLNTTRPRPSRINKPLRGPAHRGRQESYADLVCKEKVHGQRVYEQELSP